MGLFRPLFDCLARWTADVLWTTDVACCAAQREIDVGSEPPAAAAPETCASPRGDDPDAESCQTWYVRRVRHAPGIATRGERRGPLWPQFAALECFQMGSFCPRLDCLARWTADALWTTDVACCAAQHDGGFEPPAAAAPETRASRQLAAARTQADADAAEAVSPRSVTHLFEDRLESLVI
jgi:hypothetical protein